MRCVLLTLLLATTAMADTAEVVQTHARPGYAAFAASAEALAAIDGCDVATLRPAFQTVFDDWMAVAHLHLGPAEENGRALSVFFWPDPKGLGAKAQRSLLASDPAALTPDHMAEQSVAARGLSALERLLYPTEPASTEATASDPCPLIHATAKDLARTAHDLSEAWGAFGDVLLTAGQSGNTTYLTATEARQALFTQLATELEFIADRRIGRPLGTFDKPRPDLAEARASGRSMRNVILSLTALRGLAEQLHPQSPKTLAAFDHALALANALQDPVFDGVIAPPERLKVEILQQAIRATRDAAIAELAPALGVTIGFNSQDGD